MKTNTLLFLVLALVVALGASVWLTRDTQTQGFSSQPLLGEFAERLESLQKLELRTQDSILFAAERIDSEWYATHLSDLSRFPVSFDSLSDFIGDLHKAELLEAKTQNTKNYKRLGVEDLVVENAQSTLLTLQTQNANFEVLIGNPSSNGFGSFVRKPESKQSWQLDRVLDLPSDQQRWLKNPILELTLDELTRAELSGNTGWVIEKGDDGFQLVGMQEADSLVYPTVLTNSLTSILEVEFESAIPIESVELPESVDAELFIETEKGPFSARVYSLDEKHWVIYEYAQQAWLADWAFSISDFNKGQLTKGRSDFIEQTEPTSEAELP